VTRCAGRDVAVGISKLDQTDDVFRLLRKCRWVRIAFWLSGVIGGNIGDHAFFQSFRNLGHLRMDAASGPIVVQLLVDRGSGLAVEMRELRIDRNALLAMTDDTDFEHFGAAVFRVGTGENLQDIRRPGDLRNGRRRSAIKRLRLCRGARQDTERAADRGKCIEPGPATLHDGNDDNAQQRSEQHNADHCNTRPDAPRLIENVRIG
jgi:hypothetical protein